MRRPERRVRTTDTVEGELASVALACASAEAFQQSEVLDQAWRAIAAVPAELRDALLPGFISASRLEQLLALGAYETAAIEMLGNGLGYVASRSPHGYHIATVNGPGAREFIEPGETLALGLVAGLLQLLRSLHREQAGQAFSRH